MLAIKIESSSGAGNWQKSLLDSVNLYINLSPDQLQQVAETVRASIVAETRRRGWVNIPNNIFLDKISDTEYDIYIGDDYAAIAEFQHFGTKPHWIEPVNAKALHWIDPKTGEDRFSKGHDVGGIKPTYFFAIYPQAINRITKLMTNGTNRKRT